MDIEKLKASAIDEIDARRHQLSELSLKIHSNPELGFQEVKAVAWLTQYLKENGFSVEQGICGLPTAFRASYGQGKPAIAVLSEYDALPNLGHACGHNLIAACAIGAAVASKPAIDRFGGNVLVIGRIEQLSKEQGRFLQIAYENGYTCYCIVEKDLVRKQEQFLAAIQAGAFIVSSPAEILESEKLKTQNLKL